MTELPSGTVTFLLTDIEGSTGLWERAPEAMRESLARHDELFERVICQHRGVHIRPRGEGDSRFAVFARAPDAVAAALALQRTFTSEPWTTPRPIRVRIGVHTGQAQLRNGDYYGSAVNRCARLRGIGHGGQVLLSEATAALVRDDLPEGVELLDLGAHRLKDLTRPERVFQPTAPDLPSELPPLASLDAHPNNLPVQMTSVVGRNREAALVRDLLLQEDVRLLTLTGPGGSGKTRLALHVAADLIDGFADGVFFVDLTPIVDPSLIASTIAPVLGVANSEHLLDDLKRSLQQRTLLLVLDNFEQVLSGAPVIVDLLASSAGLKILVTSRAALQVRGEHELEVPPLDVPDLTQALSAVVLQQYPAVALFVERARAVRPDFALTPDNSRAVATICARLDGLPLALELAAAKIRLLTPKAMVGRLEHRLPLLTGGARDLPARQRTLRDTIAWSYDLLSPEEQRVFRALSVFVGGFTLEAAEALLGGADGPPLDMFDSVSQLVARSLVRQTGESEGEPRFGLLETIREYALERLEASSEAADVRGRHLDWYLDLAERAAEHVDGPAWAEWADRLEAEHDNIRAALRWSAGASGDPELGLRMASALRAYWSMRGHFREGRAWLARLLARSSARTAARAGALDAAGYLALRQHDYSAASTSFEKALEIWRELGDRRGMVETLRHFSIVPHYQGDYDRAGTMLQESLSLARELNDPWGINQALRHLADLALARAEYTEAAATYEHSLTLARQRGNTHEIALALRGLGHVARARGDYREARQLLRESLSLLAELRDRRCAPICLEGIACIAVGPDWAERATRLFGAVHALQQTTGSPAPPTEMADYRRTEADARAHLGEECFAAAWADGAAMSLDEAIAYALAEDETAEPIAASTAATGLESPAPARVEIPAGVPLSPREREVVALIARGLSNRQISEQLVLSIRTVERHIENVYNRLGISGKAGRAIVTAYALRHGLVDPA